MICMIEKWSKKVRGEEGRNKSVESTGNYLLPAWKRREKDKKGRKKKRREERRKDGRKRGKIEGRKEGRTEGKNE